MKYKRAITKADFLVTLICVIMAFLNLGGLSSAGRERARRMVCAVNMARLAQANHIYADNWDEQFCPPMMEDMDMPSVPTDERRHIWLTNHDFRKYIGFDETETTNLIMPKEYQCPSNILFKRDQKSEYGVLVSYAYNVAPWDHNPDPSMQFGCYWQAVGSCTIGVVPRKWQIGYKRTAIKNASERINFTESSDWWATWHGANYVKGWDIVGQGQWDDYGDVGIWGPTLYRHNEGVNLAFYDGHVEWMPKGKVFIDTDGNLTNGDTTDATEMWYHW